jgi:hypothetical protein
MVVDAKGDFKRLDGPWIHVTVKLGHHGLGRIAGHESGNEEVHREG